MIREDKSSITETNGFPVPDLKINEDVLILTVKSCTFNDIPPPIIKDIPHFKTGLPILENEAKITNPENIEIPVNIKSSILSMLGEKYPIISIAERKANRNKKKLLHIHSEFIGTDNIPEADIADNIKNGKKNLKPVAALKQIHVKMLAVISICCFT